LQSQTSLSPKLLNKVFGKKNPANPFTNDHHQPGAILVEPEVVAHGEQVAEAGGAHLIDADAVEVLLELPAAGAAVAEAVQGHIDTARAIHLHGPLAHHLAVVLVART